MIEQHTFLCSFLLVPFILHPRVTGQKGKEGTNSDSFLSAFTCLAKTQTTGGHLLQRDHLCTWLVIGSLVMERKLLTNKLPSLLFIFIFSCKKSILFSSKANCSGRIISTSKLSNTSIFVISDIFSVNIFLCIFLFMFHPIQIHRRQLCIQSILSQILENF